MAESDLENRILKVIEKTGFPLELRVSKVLQDRKYHVANNLYYLDKDEEKGREVDMRALKNFVIKSGDIEFLVRNCLLIECKRSTDQPWVIFTSPQTAYDRRQFMMQTRGANIEEKLDKILLGRSLGAVHPLSVCERRGRSFFEPFKKNSEGEMIFKSLTTSVKATIAARDSEFAAKHRSVCFYYPLVILEGRLFEAYLDNDSITVYEVDSVMVSFYYLSAKYEDEKFVVPIVTERFLPNFCSSLDSVLQFLGEKFKKNMNWFRKEGG